MSSPSTVRSIRRLAIACCVPLAALVPQAGAHENGTTAFARITVSGQTVRYSLSIPDIAGRPVAPSLRDAGEGPGALEALGDAVRRSVRLSGDATACAAGPAQASAGSGVAANVTITIDFACPAAMRTLLIRDDSFDVLGTDLHILARIEHDGTAEPFAFATEKREARVDVGTTGEVRRGVGSFFALGIEHILTGYDHLLFLLALMIGGGSAWSLVKIVTAFTLAHSVTLTAAALDWVALPGQVVEPAIALSIGYVAVHNLFLPGRTSERWLVALVFGLVHGFGFSAVLKELGLPPDGLAWSLLLFNLGVEAGQAGVVVAAIPLLIALRCASWREAGVRMMSLAVLVVAIVLFVERVFFA
jgi:hypothetical protein